VSSADLLLDAFDRVRGVVHEAVDGLSGDERAFQADKGGNSIAWLVWHLTRVQDDHVADAAGSEQVWTSKGWADRFALPFDASATGYGHGPDEVSALASVSAELLTGYYDAAHEQTLRYVRGLKDADLARIVDDAWDPPVTLSVRLVSVISDDLQHAGQAAYLRGVAERR
jgi:uncharacterized damage-inducible protein DinB